MRVLLSSATFVASERVRQSSRSADVEVTRRDLSFVAALQSAWTLQL